jgi:hypothetical protein
VWINQYSDGSLGGYVWPARANADSAREGRWTYPQLARVAVHEVNVTDGTVVRHEVTS